jgi:allophanate hydrolase subunit 2
MVKTTMKLQKHTLCALSASVAALDMNAAEKTTEKPVVTKLAAGQKLEIEEPEQDVRGMITVQTGGKTYAVFPQDIMQRANPIGNEK